MAATLPAYRDWEGPCPKCGYDGPVAVRHVPASSEFLIHAAVWLESDEHMRFSCLRCGAHLQTTAPVDAQAEG